MVPSSSFLPPSIYSHFPCPYANSRSRALWPVGALDPGEGVGGGAGTHGAHRAGTCYSIHTVVPPSLQTISRLPSTRVVIYISRSIISYFHIFTPPSLPTLLPSLPSPQLLPGAKEIIHFFASKGLPQGIATSSSTELVRHKRQHHEEHLFGRMQVVVMGDDPEVREGR